MSNHIFELKNPVGDSQGAIMMEVMDGVVIDAQKKIDILLSSSSTLMNKYINTNQVTDSKASKIIIIVVVFIMISLVVGGFFYVKEITKPLGFGHDGIAPMSGVGVELRGAFRVGTATMNYSVYTTNGPTLKTPSGVEPLESGMLMFMNLKDNNNNRAFGSRIGLLPFSNSSTEIGFSYYSAGNVGTKGTAYENIGAKLFAFDFSFVKQLPEIGGIVDIKSQYAKSTIDNITYTVEEEPGVFEDLIFNNVSSSYYGQLSYRPTMSGTDFIKKLEFVGRYSKLETPIGSGFATNKKEFSFGLNYWLNWHSVLKLNYQNITGEGGHDVVGKINEKALFLNWAIGF